MLWPFENHHRAVEGNPVAPTSSYHAGFGTKQRLSQSSKDTKNCMALLIRRIWRWHVCTNCKPIRLDTLLSKCWQPDNRRHIARFLLVMEADIWTSPSPSGPYIWSSSSKGCMYGAIELGSLGPGMIAKIFTNRTLLRWAGLRAKLLNVHELVRHTASATSARVMTQ